MEYIFYKENQFSNTESGILPKDWKLIRLGDIITEGPQNGIYKPSKYYGEGVSIIRIENININNTDKKESLKKIHLNQNELDTYSVKENDIILNRVNSIDYVGKSILIKNIKENMVYESNMMRFKFDTSKFYPDFLILYLNSELILKKLRNKAKRAVQQASVNQKDIESIYIPLISYKEQIKISEISKTLSRYLDIIVIQKYHNELLKKYLIKKLLTKGINHSEFKETSIGIYPKNWEIKKISDVCEVVTGGTPSTDHPEYFDGNIKWLKSGDIKELYIYDTSEKISQLGINNSNAKVYPKDSVAIALSGRGLTRGRTAVTKSPMACSQSVAFMIPNSQILPEYIHYNLSNRYMEIRNLTGHLDRSGLNLSIIRDILIPIPSLVEQKEIISILLKLEEKIIIDKFEKEKIEKINQYIMNNLFTGKFRVTGD